MLDDTDYSQSNGTPIQQFDYLGGANQQWDIVLLPSVAGAPGTGAPGTLELYADFANGIVTATGTTTAPGGYTSNTSGDLRNNNTGETAVFDSGVNGLVGAGSLPFPARMYLFGQQYPHCVCNTDNS